MCKSGTCDKFVTGNIPFQFDAGHLTAEGSIRACGKIARGRRLAVSAAGFRLPEPRQGPRPATKRPPRRLNFAFVANRVRGHDGGHRRLIPDVVS
jgi:hypothetical protein